MTASAPTDEDGTPEARALLAELVPDLADVEALHAVAHAKAMGTLWVVITVVVALTAVAFGGLLGSFGTMGLLIPVVGGLITGGLGWYMVVIPAAEDYRRAFKKRVVGRLVARRYPEARYAPDGGIRVEDFKLGRLFRSDIDRYKTEDLIEGRFGATAMRLAEVHAEYETTSTDSQGHTTTQWHTIFKGWFAVADFNKHFNGTTLVVPDSAQSAFGGFGQTLQSLGRAFSDAKLVALEDPEFEKLFAVYGTDQVEARYILSTSLMRRLIDFRTRMGTKVHVAFVDEQNFVAVASSKNHFEPPSIWSAKLHLSEQDIDAFLVNIAFAESIVDGLNLNTRIWGKA